MTTSPGQSSVAEIPRDYGAELLVLDGAVDPATCRALIESSDADPWLTSTAEIPRAANGPHSLPPRRINELSLVGADERPRFCVVDDPLLALRLFYRLAKALPDTREAAELVGIKPLLRCLRFSPGEGTELHRDPARETTDGQRSQLSVLLFLNDDFTGGAIEFPSAGRVVEPRVGRAIVFPHELVHRDLSVEQGSKFVLEAEVFYSPHWQPYLR
ncbi:MAG: 2OG-Fe(II) oxygenase [Enhygromyxa sp.]